MNLNSPIENYGVPLDYSMEAQEKRSRILSFFLLSIFLHVLLLLSLQWIRWKPLTASNEPVYVDLSKLPPLEELQKQFEKERMRQIVQTEKNQNQSAPKDAKYLGETNQTVDEQTKSRQVDIFRKGAGTAAQVGGKGEKLSLKDLAPTKAITPPSQKEIDGFEKQRKLIAKQEAGDGKPKGDINPGSATNDYLNDVKDSDRTMLSTKEFVYYGYYHRIRQKLEAAWNTRLRSTLDSYGFSSASGRQLATNRNYITGVVVVLDRNGKITGVQVLQASGAHELDQAAVDAFNTAGPFPDPPTGLVDANGEIKIRWDFVLQS